MKYIVTCSDREGGYDFVVGGVHDDIQEAFGAIILDFLDGKEWCDKYTMTTDYDSSNCDWEDVIFTISNDENTSSYEECYRIYYLQEESDKDPNRIHSGRYHRFVRYKNARIDYLKEPICPFNHEACEKAYSNRCYGCEKSIEVFKRMIDYQKENDGDN